MAGVRLACLCGVTGNVFLLFTSYLGVGCCILSLGCKGVMWLAGVAGASGVCVCRGFTDSFFLLFTLCYLSLGCFLHLLGIGIVRSGWVIVKLHQYRLD